MHSGADGRGVAGVDVVADVAVGEDNVWVRGEDVSILPQEAG